MSQNLDPKVEEIALTSEEVGELARRELTRGEEKQFERSGLEYDI